MLSTELKSDWGNSYRRVSENVLKTLICCGGKKATKMWVRDEELGESVDEYTCLLQNMARTAAVSDDMSSRYVRLTSRAAPARHSKWCGFVVPRQGGRSRSGSVVSIGSNVRGSSSGRVCDPSNAEQNADNIQRLAANLTTSTVDRRQCWVKY